MKANGATQSLRRIQFMFHGLTKPEEVIPGTLGPIAIKLQLPEVNLIPTANCNNPFSSGAIKIQPL